MGKMIEKVALERGHEIVCKIDADNTADFHSEAFRNADVAIEFSVPSTALQNIRNCFEAKVPVVVGTTGWNNSLKEIEKECVSADASLLYGSNFSIGVNIFMAINRYVSSIMNLFPGYSPELSETHHIHKLDHPSGTAITIAEELTERVDRIGKWIEPCLDSITPDSLPVNFTRRGEVPGIHTISWDSDFDTITLSHSARSREGFASGAVMAAEWLPGHKGVFTVADMLAAFTGMPEIFKTTSCKKMSKQGSETK